MPGNRRRGRLDQGTGALSATSSCQLSLFANSVVALPSADAETPRPPRTSNRPAASVFNSPRYTGLPRNLPWSNFTPDWFLPLIDWFRGSRMTRPARAAPTTPVFRARAATRGSMPLCGGAWSSAALRFTRSTVQVIVASSAVISRRRVCTPAASLSYSKTRNRTACRLIWPWSLYDPAAIEVSGPAPAGISRPGWPGVSGPTKNLSGLSPTRPMPSAGWIL
jgi:hypothetical protein